MSNTTQPQNPQSPQNKQNKQSPQANHTKQNLILLTILLAVFVVPSSISGTAIALEFIAQSFSDITHSTHAIAQSTLSPTQATAQSQATFSALLQWVVNSFNLCFATFTLIWGAFADRFGARKCLILGVFLYLIGSALSVLSLNLLLLDIARGIAGLGGASVFACGASILVKTFDEKHRAKAFALFGTTAGLGITLSPTISGLLIELFSGVSIAFFDISFDISWRSIFAFHFIVLFVVLLLSPVLPKDKKATQDEQAIKPAFDALGAILFIGFLFSFMLFITRISEISSPTTLWILAFSVIIGIIFGAQQRYLHAQGKFPLLDFSVLSNARFVGYMLVCVIAGFSFVVLLTYFPSFLQRTFDLSAAHSGLFMLFLTAPMLFCPIIAGKILASSKSANTPKLLSLAMSLMMSLGLFVLIVVLRYTSGVALFVALACVLLVIGVGMGLHAGAIDNLALSSVESAKSGFAAGVLNGFRLGSEAVGVAIYGALMALFLSQAQSSLDFASQNLINAFSYTIGILGVFCVVLSLLVWKFLRYNAPKN